MSFVFCIDKTKNVNGFQKENRSVDNRWQQFDGRFSALDPFHQNQVGFCVLFPRDESKAFHFNSARF